MLEKLFIELGLTNLVRIALSYFIRSFPQSVFCNTSYSVHILEKLNGNGRTTRNVLGASITSRRKQRKKTLMVKLKAVYPYGLNDCLGDDRIRFRE